MASWIEDFHEHGFAIIRASVPAEKAAYYRSEQLKWLRKADKGFKLDDRTTWTSKNLPPSFKQGIYTAAAHEAFMWDARLEPGIIAAFAELWDTQKLLVSFDGMNVTMPGVTIPPWPHTDQHSSDPDFICAQGLLNTGPCGPDDGGLILVKSSAKLWNAFWADEAFHAKSRHDPQAAKERDEKKFTETDLAWFTKRGCVVEKLVLQPGDLVMWDSRTIHYNSAPRHEIRSALYLSYGPSEGADLQKKAGMFFGKQSTNHWAHVNLKSVQETKPYEEHEWTQRLAQLAGVEPYE